MERNLSGADRQKPPDYFRHFCLALLTWAEHPLTDWLLFCPTRLHEIGQMEAEQDGLEGPKLLENGAADCEEEEETGTGGNCGGEEEAGEDFLDPRNDAAVFLEAAGNLCCSEESGGETSDSSSEETTESDSEEESSEAWQESEGSDSAT